MPRKLGKVGRNVVEQIERSKQNELSRLVYALGIRHVGEKARRARWRGTSGRWTAMLDAPVEALQTVPDIGPVVAASVRAFADEPHNRELVDEAGAAGVNMARAAGAGDRRARPAGRQDVRPHRHAGDDDAARRRRPRSSGSAAR